MHENQGIRCAIYRGGTSRGVYFLDNDLPFSQAIRAQILLHILGSPDPRQIDGLGGGTSSTSKTMIIGPSRLQGTEVQMLFAQVSLHSSIVDWRGTCGNLTTAVGPFAIDQGLVTAVEPVTEVSIYSVNTRKRIVARVPVSRGRAVTEGDYKIPGVRGTGARIELEYVDPAGSFNGRLLPTGSPRDVIELEGKRKFTVSIVDAGHIVVFCHAHELGLRGTELPSELEEKSQVMATLEAIRSAAAEQIGIVSSRNEATRTSPAVPKIGFVSAPAPYSTMDGRPLAEDDIDIVGRLLTMQTAHRAYMGAGAICTGVAALAPGTIVSDLAGARMRETGLLRIGHPQGVMDVSVKAALQNGDLRVQSATIARTARRIMEGYAFVPQSCFLSGEKG
ncbi:MAG: PrpF domain-containing protein [Candidatus Acidiferrales bacterium]